MSSGEIISKVPCPRCLAFAGELCRTTFSKDGSPPGVPVAGHHMARLRLLNVFETHRGTLRFSSAFRLVRHRGEKDDSGVEDRINEVLDEREGDDAVAAPPEVHNVLDIDFGRARQARIDLGRALASWPETNTDLTDYREALRGAA